MINKHYKNAIILIGLFLLVSLYFIIKMITRYWDGTRLDFPSFYYAANLTLNGLSPYNQVVWKRANLLHLPNQDLYPFLNFPFSLVLFFPLRLVDFQVSQTILLLINIAATFLLIYLVFIKILKKPILTPFVMIGGSLLLLFPPVRATISHGQVNLIVIVLICIFWWAVKENKSSLAISLPLALSILLKVYPGIFLLYLFTKKRYKSILITVGIIALFALAAFLVLPAETWSDWYITVGSVKYGGVYARKIPSWMVGNQSFNGFITRFFLGARSRQITSISDYILPLNWLEKRIASLVFGYLSAGFLVLVWLFLAFRRRQEARNESILDLEISMLLLTMFLIAPISWDHHLVFILPSIIVLMDHFISNKSFRASFWVVIFLSGLLSVNIDLSHPFFQRGILGIFVSTQFLSVLGIWFIHLITILNSPKMIDPESV